MRRASSRERTSPTKRRLPSQMANSATEAVSGIGKKYVPSSVASVSLRKICSTCVVATCCAIFASILIDLIGSERGSGQAEGEQAEQTGEQRGGKSSGVHRLFLKHWRRS